MPSVSGLALPRSQQRLTDSYYVLQGNEWKPQIVDDPGCIAESWMQGQGSQLGANGRTA